jgi:hypothetical protein
MACAHPSKFPDAIVKALVNEGSAKTDDHFWWLSDDDRSHRNISALLKLEQEEGSAVYLEKSKDWTKYLEEHFRAISQGWKERLGKEEN